MPAYTKARSNWLDYPDTTTPVRAADLNTIEQGIADAHTEHIEKTIVDAKGDLIVATAADTVARKAVGANDTVLTAASVQADGTIWQKIVNAMVDAAAAISVTKIGTVPAARVFHNANQSIATGTPTVLAFNSERFDTDVIHDTVTNNSRLTCKTAGKYAITTNVEFAANGTGARVIEILLNGTTIISRTTTPATAAVNQAFVLTCDYELAVNDYVEVRVTQDSGGALNILVQSNWSPEFSMVRIGT